ncbi:MAG: hypothetical protein UZ21_OP11001000314 [Microgenomates bacterium OLB22]|nr:MAG: hypothetical protein UZ21_OP11001000314 [Microgenomates bacterium OLB22]
MLHVLWILAIVSLLGNFGKLWTLNLDGLNSQAQAASFKSRISIQLSDYTRYYREGSDEQLVFTDHLGTSKRVVGDEMASLYFPYGQVYGDELPETISGGYTGQRRLGETPVMYYKARFYNPELGLFIQPDTVEKNADSYAYVHGNPIIYNDPTGNCALCKKVFNFFSGDADYQEVAKKPSNGVERIHKAAGFVNSFTGIFDLLEFASIPNPQQHALVQTINADIKQYVDKDANKMLFVIGAIMPFDDGARMARVARDGNEVMHFTTNFMRGDRAYLDGFLAKLQAWEANPSIDAGLRVKPDVHSRVPVSDPIKSYDAFKARFRGIYGEREYDVDYWGLFARPVTKKALKISPANPGDVKHGMLTGMQPTDLAGEFSYRWTLKPDGTPTFTIGEINLSSGGYTPRVYDKKLNEARRLLESQIYSGLADPSP